MRTYRYEVEVQTKGGAWIVDDQGDRLLKLLSRHGLDRSDLQQIRDNLVTYGVADVFGDVRVRLTA